MTATEAGEMLEKMVNEYISDEIEHEDDGGLVDATRAVALELRALRYMLREEIREAAWRISPDKPFAKLVPYDQDDPIASRKAPPPVDASNHTT